MRRLMLLLAGFLVLLASVAVTSAGGAMRVGARWVATDLGTLGGKESDAQDINNKGQIVGSAEVRIGVYHAFLWQDGKMRDLGALGGRESRAGSINESGQIVGSIDTGARDSDGMPIGRSFLWKNGKVSYLDERVTASAINDRGQIVGSITKSAWPHAVLWQNGKMTDLGILPGGIFSFAADINEFGQIVGESLSLDFSKHAFLWQKGTMLDLGTLGDPNDDVNAINDHGQIVGARNGRAFVWEKGKYRYLSAFGDKRAQAGDINERGQVAGWWSRALGESIRAAVWQHGRMTLLPNLPGTGGSYAVAINEHGQIVGWSFEGAGERHAVLWTLRRGWLLGSSG